MGRTSAWRFPRPRSIDVTLILMCPAVVGLRIGRQCGLRKLAVFELASNVFELFFGATEFTKRKWTNST